MGKLFRFALLFAAFSFKLIAGDATQLLLAAGDRQSAKVGERVPGVVCVIALDASNRPVSGVSVTWHLLTGDGSLTGETQLTDHTGIATLGGWTLGPVPGGNSIQADSAGLPSVVFTATGLSPNGTDTVVVKWNNTLLTSFQNLNTAPTIAARALGILNTSMYDAWAAYHPTALGTQLGASLRRPESERNDTNRLNAISYAAFKTLNDLFPSQKSFYEAQLMSLGLDPKNTSEDVTTPAGIGLAAATANINFRHGDGSNQLGDLNPGAYSDYTSYTPGPAADPNRWHPLTNAEGVTQKFLTPHWGLVKTFAIGNSDSKQRAKLMPKAPAKYPSKAFDKQAQELLDLSANLDDTSKTQAAYWIDKAGTVTPPGHWFKFAQFVSLRDRHSLNDDVKMFFALGNAMLDSSVAVWDAKRHYDSERPATAIPFLFKGKSVRAWGGPNLGTQMIDGSTWRSFIDTPGFAEHVSGHSTFSAAGAAILKLFTHSSNFGYSEDIPTGYTSIELNVPASPITFTWDRFEDAAADAGLSRRIGGIHFKNGDLDGRKLGQNVAKIVFKRAQDLIDGKVKN